MVTTEISKEISNTLLSSVTRESIDMLDNYVRSTTPEEVVKLVKYTRQILNRRDTSYILVVLLSRYHSKSKYIRESTRECIVRVSDICKLLSMYSYLESSRVCISERDKKYTNCKSIHLGRVSRGILRGIRDSFFKFSRREYSRYRSRSRVTLRDAIRLCHPRPLTSEQSRLYRDILDNKLDRVVDKYDLYEKIGDRTTSCNSNLRLKMYSEYFSRVLKSIDSSGSWYVLKYLTKIVLNKYVSDECIDIVVRVLNNKSEMMRLCSTEVYPLHRLYRVYEILHTHLDILMKSSKKSSSGYKYEVMIDRLTRVIRALECCVSNIVHYDLITYKSYSLTNKLYVCDISRTNSQINTDSSNKHSRDTRTIAVLYSVCMLSLYDPYTDVTILVRTSNCYYTVRRSYVVKMGILGTCRWILDTCIDKYPDSSSSCCEVDDIYSVLKSEVYPTGVVVISGNKQSYTLCDKVPVELYRSSVDMSQDLIIYDLDYRTTMSSSDREKKIYYLSGDVPRALELLGSYRSTELCNPIAESYS